MSRFRSLAAFLAEASPLPAEQMLLDCCRSGGDCVLNGGIRPDHVPGPVRNGDAVTIRADLLGLAITGGTPGCGFAEAGIYLSGARITGKLNLGFATARGMTTLANCLFEEEIDLFQARLNRLSLHGSRLMKGMNATGMTVAQSVLLRGEFVTHGPINLTGATIGGQLVCTGATFDLKAEAADGTERYALAADSLRVANTFFWKDVTLHRGIVHLGNARVGALNDDLASWRQRDKPPAGSEAKPGEGNHCLDGFVYDHLWGGAEDDGRWDWLRRGTFWRGRFRPQPYLQLAQVLRRQGHDREARPVLVEMERRIAAYRQEADRARARRLWRGEEGTRGDLGSHWITWRGAQAWDWLFRSVTGYGYMPHRALWWLLGLVTLGTTAHFLAFRAGVMVPASADVLNSAQWAEAVAAAPDNPVSAWLQTAAGRHYETFGALGYALDLSVPVIDLGQEAAWGASTEMPGGGAIWLLGWAIKLGGWLVSGLGLAAAAGIVQRDRS